MENTKKRRKKTSLLKSEKRLENIPSRKKGEREAPTYKHFGEYVDMFTFLNKPVQHSFIERLAQDFVNWARDDKDALLLCQFFAKKGICYDTAQEWKNKHPKLKLAFAMAKRLVGARREAGAIKKEYEPGMIKTSMRMYHKEWEEIEIARAKLQQERDEFESKKQIQWVLDKYPDTRIVPVKNEKEEE